MNKREVVIIGAGPAGLGAALELQKNNIKDILVIDRNSIPGGLSRTINYKGNHFDIGPHRFYTKNRDVNEVWHQTLKSNFKAVNRLTRIYYKNKFFNYPLKPFNALINLGISDSAQVILDYFITRVQNNKKEVHSFEDWVSRQFGNKLYQIFFKTYSEKIWGIDCKDISADWAAQRIKGLNLYRAVIDSLNLSKNNKNSKTLIDEFDYPVFGAGMMYEKMAEKIIQNNGDIIYNSRVKQINIKNDKIESILVNTNEKDYLVSAKMFFSSMPLTKIIQAITPKAKESIINASKELFFRDHITVNLLIDSGRLFPDHWIYVHSPEVKMARLANYNNFSSKMTENKNETAMSVEYFVFKNDDIWTMDDKDIFKLAVEELHYLNLVDKKLVIDGFTIRETDTYPVYFIGYEKYFNIIKEYISQLSNLQCIGRGGMYKYNNQDHSLYTGILAAKNYCGSNYNIWNVNVDAEYHEDAKRYS
ncbi:MAG: NAD(P)-binding protein [Atribacterota bacterium]|nr:NAD(P)-binding protein [Atribacterota bacterium]